MLYTGYFAKTKDYIKAGLNPVSVAGTTPQFFDYPRWRGFAPRLDLFLTWKNQNINNEEYAELYIEFLDATVTEKALENIKKIAKAKDVVMCCYETPHSFCHRQYLAKWLSKQIGIEIKEYEFKE